MRAAHRRIRSCRSAPEWVFATERSNPLYFFEPSKPDDHSPLDPHLPIPNRTVKRRRADDSTDYPCESRSSSGTLQKPKARLARAFVPWYPLYGTARLARAAFAWDFACAGPDVVAVT